MSSKQDVMEAKRVLSARLLAAGARSRVVSRRPSLLLRDAVADAGRNVHAVGIGRKLVAGHPTDTLSVRLYVVQKLAKSAIPPRDLLPEQLAGVPCDIIESQPAFMLKPRRQASARKSPAPGAGRRETAPVRTAALNCTDNRRGRLRPLSSGTSVAHGKVTAGTIACFCRSTRPGDTPDDVFLLSNNHVLADVNNGTAGDDVLQPGPADGGTSDDHVADLHRFIRIRLGGDLPNRVDAAIARLISGTAHELEICGLGRVAGIDRAVEDMRVRKHGRTTGLTDGVISDESIDSLVGMDHNDSQAFALFQGQMRIERAGASVAFGLGGDSGSLVLGAGNRRAVGLYFAGPENGVYGLANHIGEVLDQLQIELLI